MRDTLLSGAHVGVFRPVWQQEILDTVYRNSIGIGVTRRDMTEQQATAGVEHALTQMRRALTDACAETELWTPLVPHMTCDEKDRHVSESVQRRVVRDGRAAEGDRPQVLGHVLRDLATALRLRWYGGWRWSEKPRRSRPRRTSPPGPSSRADCSVDAMQRR